MKRRDFISLLGGAAAWPVMARAQQAAIPVIGYLSAGSPETSAHLVTAFRKGLNESGYIEGGNVAIEFHWANNQFERLPDLAADLVRRGVAVIATTGGIEAALAAKATTTIIPIVFAVGGDPVQLGIVTSLSSPGGNVTGVTGMSAELSGKRVGLVHELAPKATSLAVLVNPATQSAESAVTDVKEAASTIGMQVVVLSATNSREIDVAFATFVQKRAAALLVASDPLFISRRVQLATLAVKHTVAAIFPFREDTEAGGLMSYGPNIADANRQAGVYTGRILKGEKPGDLPVLQPTKFEFIINLQTARILGIEVPPGLLAIADEVIE
jgi:putative tryptophan/tyrosine transport system substrate-binding protein